MTMTTTTASASAQQQHQEALETITEFPALLSHEDTLARTPYDLKAWWLYLNDLDDHLLDKPDNVALRKVRRLIGQRSVASLPGSYKLWKNHWEFVVQQHKYQRLDDLEKPYTFVIETFETALRTLHSFPRVWMEYLHFVLSLADKCLDIRGTWMTKTTFLRKLANRALQALPLAQHEQKVWPVLLECWKDESEDLADFFADDDDDNDKEENSKKTESPEALQLRVETRCRLLKRYCMLQPTYRATLCQVYIQNHKWGEAAVLYQHMLSSASPDHPEYFDWWNALADLCTQHPMEVEQAGVPWEAMVRAGIQMANAGNNSNSVLAEMQGMLWSKLADSWIRRGEFDLARSVFEEALESVSRVRDFTILFDAYLQFEEGLLEAVAEEMEEEEGDDTLAAEQQQDENDWDILLGSAGKKDNDKPQQPTMADMELALARAEYLTARRPILLNRVLLRQNPHNIGEWLERSKLYVKQKEPVLAAAALEEALQTVRANKANNGSPSSLVTELMKLYEEESVYKARDLLDRICNQHEYAFRNPDDLAECYAAWVELELRNEKWDDALAIARGAVAPVNRANGNKALNLTKSLRLWDLLLDLEESLGTVQTTKDAYNRALEIKVATPMHIMNFSSFLAEHKYFEESFTVYERGVELFAFPHPGAKLLWKSYIEAFLKRYKGVKIERVRDLFQRCLETCPPEESSEFFMMNGEFEEEYGLTKRALSVYSAMCQKVPAMEKFTAYQLYIAKTTKYLGLTATRDIYQEAIEKLEDAPAAELCQDFAKMETTLQEIERARAVLTYGAQMADPRRNPEYWKTWNEFEIEHGNEETFREMLRVKRTVEAQFSTINYNAAEMEAGSKLGNLTNEEAMSMIASREGMEVEKQQNASAISGFVAGSKRASEMTNLDEVEQRVAKLRKATAAAGAAQVGGATDNANAGGGEDEEIDIDDVDEEEEEAAPAPAPVKDVKTKAVPAGVFGGLAEETGAGGEDKKGALERLRSAAASGK